MRKLLFYLILLFIGYIAFMYFFGKGEDRSNAEAIVHDSKEVARSIGVFLKNQKEKYDDGEFDRLIRRVENSIDRLKIAEPERKDDVRQTLLDLQRELRLVDPTKLNEENRLKLDEMLRDIDDALKREPG